MGEAAASYIFIVSISIRAKRSTVYQQAVRSLDSGNFYHSWRGGRVDRFADVDFAALRYLDVNEQ
jgi:hypothetical protein